MQLTLDSYDELRRLHSALCEARFHPEPEHRDVQGSPVSADTANKVYELLIENAPDETEANGWRQHRELNRTSHLMPAIEGFARRLAKDNSLSMPEKKAGLKICAAPFILPDHLIEDIFERVSGSRPTLW
jgi:hypothetical protein